MPLIVLPPSAMRQLDTRLGDGRVMSYGIEQESCSPSGYAQAKTEKQDFISAICDALNYFFLSQTPHERFASCAKELGSKIPQLERDAWGITQDVSLHAPMGSAGIELVSPVFDSAKGLNAISEVFTQVHQEGFIANKSCGLQVNVSLGWSKGTSSPKHLAEIKNVLLAFRRNIGFLKKLVSTDRHNNYHCMNNEIIPESDITSAENLPSLLAVFKKAAKKNRPKAWMLNPFSIEKHGALEFRLKEGANYQASLGYIRFILEFTRESALNPNIAAETLAKRLFGDVISYKECPVSRRDQTIGGKSPRSLINLSRA